MARGIRNLVREALELHSADNHAEALGRANDLARVNPGSALALNLLGTLHVDAARVAWDESDQGGGEESAATVEHHFDAALDAFSAAARIAPNCVLTAVFHAEALSANDRYSQAQLELLRVLSKTTNHADPTVNHVGFDVVGGSTAKDRMSEAVHKASARLEEVTYMINNEIVLREVGNLLGRDASIDGVRERARFLSETYRYSSRAQLLRVYIELEQARAIDLPVRRRGYLRGIQALISRAADYFDSSLLIALFHATVLFVLDMFDESEGECRQALRIEEPTDPTIWTI